MVDEELPRMASFAHFSRVGMAVVLAAAVLVSACARTPNSEPGGLGVAAGAGAATPGSAQDFIVNVGDRVFFDTDSVVLTPQSRQTLDRQAQWLNQYPRYTITIEGHADERGTREYNIALGSRRAQAAQGYLVSRGVGSNRLRIISYGKERPVAVCDDISCWSQNRRAVTLVN
jgi:peptidoglycan-associated lipoprotein